MNRKRGHHCWKYSLLLLRGDERLDRLAMDASAYVVCSILCSVRFHIIPQAQSEIDLSKIERLQYLRCKKRNFTSYLISFSIFKIWTGRKKILR
jgi:hypothetical protein